VDFLIWPFKEDEHGPINAGLRGDWSHSALEKANKASCRELDTG